MALRDQPYFPFYVEDYLTDEKLVECSAASQGVYTRIMCIMHKSEEYGVILLRQKDKQTEQQVKNFAEKLSKHMPFKIEVVENAISELVEEGVLQISGDKLLQKRMIRDNLISIKRSEAGSKGGFATAKKSANIPPNKTPNPVNTNEYEYENTIINESDLKEGIQGGDPEPPKKKVFIPPTFEEKKKVFIPPTFEEFESYCAENNHKNIAATAFKGYQVADWHDSRGKKIKNWKQKLCHVWFREENADGKFVAKKETMDEMLDRLQAEGKIPRSPQ